MKTAAKVGITMIISGVVLSMAGGMICLATPRNERYIFCGDPVSYDKKIDGDFTELQLEAAFLNIEIRQGDEFRVVAEDIPENLDLEVKKSGSRLEIVNSNDLKFMSSFKIGGIKAESVGTLTIYIPDNTLKRFDVEADFCSVDASEFETDDFCIECSFGEYNIRDAKFDKIDIESSFSDIFLENIRCKSINFFGDFGDLDADSLRITEDGKFNVSFGDINAQLLGDNYSFDSIANMGNVNTFKCDKADVNIKVDAEFGSADFEK